VAAGLRALVARERLGWEPGDDTLQLGADVVVDRDCQIAFLHLPADASDRSPPGKLIAIVRGFDRAPAGGDELPERYREDTRV